MSGNATVYHEMQTRQQEIRSKGLWWVTSVKMMVRISGGRAGEGIASKASSEMEGQKWGQVYLAVTAENNKEIGLCGFFFGPQRRVVLTCRVCLFAVWLLYGCLLLCVLVAVYAVCAVCVGCCMVALVAGWRVVCCVVLLVAV